MKKTITLLLLFASIAFGQAPSVPKIDCYWLCNGISAEKPDSTFTFLIKWAPSSTAPDTNTVRLIIYSDIGTVLDAVSYYNISSATDTTTMHIASLRHDHVYFMEWNAKNASGTSPWSPVTNWLTRVIPLQSTPIKGAFNVNN